MKNMKSRPRPARTNIHDQRMLIVVLKDGTRHEVYNKEEAARLCASTGNWAGGAGAFFSKMKNAFRRGGTIAVLGFGMTVFKTDTPAPHRHAPSPSPRKYPENARAFPAGVTGTPPFRMMCGYGDPNNHGTKW